MRDTSEGWLRLVTCHGCGHRAVLPAELLLRKHGELALVEFALTSIRCGTCGGRGATLTMVRLCDPSRPRVQGRRPV